MRHTEDRADRCAVAVGIKTGFVCQADGFSVIAVAVKQGSDANDGIGNGMAPVMVVVFIVGFMNRFEAFLFRNAVLIAVVYAHECGIQTRCGRNFPKAGQKDVFDVIGGCCGGKASGYKHSSVNTVFDMRDGGIAPCHISSGFRISGIDVAVIIGTDLCADPFSVRILIDRTDRRLIALDKVAEGDVLGGAIGILSLITHPGLHNV